MQRLGGTDWQLILVAEVKSESRKYRYMPRSDFHLSTHRLPLLVFEVLSNSNQSDRYRMLLQASCAARLGNSLG
jgi:hypothetical protein